MAITPDPEETKLAKAIQRGVQQQKDQEVLMGLLTAVLMFGIFIVLCVTWLPSLTR